MGDLVICPSNPDDVADEYVMGRLPLDQVASVEAHLAICRNCSEVVANTRRFIGSIRRAGKRLEERSAVSGGAKEDNSKPASTGSG
jgi:anti-sigma factor RsiW